MARTTLTVQQLSGPYPDPLNLDTITFTACDAVNFNDFVFNGNELIIARNVNVSTPRNVTLTSVKDALKRTGDVTKQIAANGYAIFEARDVVGWQQSDGRFYLQGDNVDIQFAIVRLKR
jgi:hypothetical protein